MAVPKESLQGWYINEQNSQVFFTLISFNVLMMPLNDVQQRAERVSLQLMIINSRGKQLEY